MCDNYWWVAYFECLSWWVSDEFECNLFTSILKSSIPIAPVPDESASAAPAAEPPLTIRLVGLRGFVLL